MLICLTSQFELRKNEREKGSGDKSHSHTGSSNTNRRPRSSSCVSTYSKMLAKIPFILLATWGIYMSCKPPNPQPPQRERFPLSVPHWQWLENSGYVQWAPVIIRVSNYAWRIIFIRTHWTIPARFHNSYFASLRYQLSWHLRTLLNHHPYPNQYYRCSFGTMESPKTFICQMPLQ